MTRLKEIETRLSSIKEEIDKEGADIGALGKEVDTLVLERDSILKSMESRAQLLKKISAGEGGEGAPAGKCIEERAFGIESKEYRDAFLKHLRGIELSGIEKRTITTAGESAGSAVPTMTLNKILEKVRQYAPLLDKIDLMHIKGNVTMPAEGTTLDAKIHAEGAQITADDDTINKITLSGYEITKLITISKSVETMSIDAFENWLVRKLGKKIAEKLSGFILNGTGSAQPQGINAITWDETNSVTVGKAVSLTEADVRKAVGLLNGGYDAGAEWIMSKKTFFDSFHTLMNSSKHNIITESSGSYYICGYPVTYDDRVKTGEAFLGNLMEGYVGNLQENVTVTSQFVTRENSYDFLGSAIFDGKVSAVEAFVKISKESEA